MRTYGCANLRELEQELQQRGLLAQQASTFTHNLEMLLRLTGRQDVMRRNAEVWRQFVIVNTWIPAWRYCPDQSSSNDAADFVAAVDGVAKWIEYNI